MWQCRQTVGKATGHLARQPPDASQFCWWNAAGSVGTAQARSATFSVLRDKEGQFSLCLSWTWHDPGIGKLQNELRQILAGKEVGKKRRFQFALTFRCLTLQLGAKKRLANNGLIVAPAPNELAAPTAANHSPLATCLNRRAPREYSATMCPSPNSLYL